MLFTASVMEQVNQGSLLGGAHDRLGQGPEDLFLGRRHAGVAVAQDLDDLIERVGWNQPYDLMEMNVFGVTTDLIDGLEEFPVANLDCQDLTGGMQIVHDG